MLHGCATVVPAERPRGVKSADAAFGRERPRGLKPAARFGAMCAAWAWAGLTWGAEVKLQHDLTPGSLCTYDVTIEVSRRPVVGIEATASAPATQAADSAAEVWKAKLTRGLYSHRQEGFGVCAQMLEFERASSSPADTQPSGVAALERFAPDLAGIDVQFSTQAVSAVYAPLLLPRRPGWSRTMLQMLLDASSWPSDPVAVGASWDRPFRIGATRVPRRITVDAVQNAGSDLRCRLTLKTSPPRDAPDEGERLVSAESTIVWSVSTRQLVSQEGKVAYEVGEWESGKVGKWEGGKVGKGGAAEEAPVRVELRVRIERRSQRRLPAALHAKGREAVAELANAFAGLTTRDDERALKTVDEVLDRWPKSRWRPAAGELRKQIEADRGARSPMATGELKQAMVRLLEVWVSAEEAEDMELLVRCRGAATHLADVNRPEIVRLLDDADGGVRAVALFALAFGDAPGDLARMHEACGDADAHVRRTAMAALAVRGSPLTDVERVAAGLRDGDEGVRRAACGAAGACFAGDSASAGPVRDALIERLGDESARVVVAAAEALLKLGQPEDREAVRRAAESAGRSEVRDALLELLEGEDRAESAPS